MQAAPIGVFDSGIGGLTVAAGIAQKFPNESITYFGDTAHLPYGEKSVAAIREYSKEITNFLIRQGCKMIVIACNSASASAFEVLQKEYADKIVIVDVISPLVEFINEQQFNKVGVIATKATISTNVYYKQLKINQPKLEVASLATSLLVPMIEEGFLNNEVSQVTIDKYLSYPDFENIDALLLACTHYPLIRKEISNYLGANVQVFDSIDAVTNKLQQIFKAKPELKNNSIVEPSYQFWVSDYTPQFEKAAKLFYGREVKLKKVMWDHNEALVITK